MSDIDRVFARLGGRHSGAGDQRELRSIPGKGRSTGSRVVEVVRLPARGSADGRDQVRRPAFNVRAQTWDDGFPAKSTAPVSAAPEPIVEQAPAPTVHVMPMWAPAMNEVPDASPSPQFVERRPGQVGRRAARSVEKEAGARSRRVADPFNADDDGANCLRCGYVVEPARERHGLMTCATCG